MYLDVKRKALLFFLLTFLIVPKAVSGYVKVVATIFPFYDLTREIVKDRGDVAMLVKPGTDIHHFEPKPSDIALILKADFFIYGGEEIEPYAKKILSALGKKGPAFVNVCEGISLLVSDGVKDPHIWLDFSNVEKIIEKIAENLARKDIKNGSFFKKNAELLKENVRSLEKKYSETLSSCRIRTIIHAGHYSFGYLAKKYNLNYVAAYPATHEHEPKPSQIAKMKETIRKEGAKYIFYEELTSPKVAKMLAKELKLEMLKLNPCGNISIFEFKRGATFLKLMEENLENLKKGLECGQ